MKERAFVDHCFSNKLHCVPDSKSSLTNVVDDITYMLTVPGLIKLSRKDIKQIADGSNHLLGISAEARGRYRAEMVGKELVSNYSSAFKNKAKSALFNVIGSSDLTLYEVNEIAEYVYNVVTPQSNLIFSAIIDEKKKDFIKATVVFGFN